MNISQISSAIRSVVSRAKEIVQQPVQLMEKTFAESEKVAQRTANTAAITGRGGKVNTVA